MTVSSRVGRRRLDANGASKRARKVPMRTRLGSEIGGEEVTLLTGLVWTRGVMEVGSTCGGGAGETMGMGAE